MVSVLISYHTRNFFRWPCFLVFKLYFTIFIDLGVTLPCTSLRAPMIVRTVITCSCCRYFVFLISIFSLLWCLSFKLFSFFFLEFSMMIHQHIPIPCIRRKCRSCNKRNNSRTMLWAHLSSRCIPH